MRLMEGRVGGSGSWLRPTSPPNAPQNRTPNHRTPPNPTHSLIYFIDDLNMPFVDKYDTQSAIELARQMVDYRGWYDKQKILLKEIQNCQYAAAMNPTAGSFNITPRMQRHFVTFAVQVQLRGVGFNGWVGLILDWAFLSKHTSTLPQPPPPSLTTPHRCPMQT